MSVTREDTWTSVTHSQAVLPFLLPLITNALLFGPFCPSLFLEREREGVETPVCVHEGCYPRTGIGSLFHVSLFSATPGMRMEVAHHRWRLQESVPAR